MENKLRNWFFLLGVFFLLVAVGLLGYREWKAMEAGTLCTTLAADYQKLFPDTVYAEEAGQPDARQDGNIRTVLEVDGVDLVGVLQFPDREVTLPVAGEYNEDLRVPTLVSGEHEGSKLWIKGMDYAGQFGILEKVVPGEEIYFEDLWGVLYAYTVTSKNITSLEKIDTDADMVLFFRRSITTIYQVSLERTTPKTID